MPYSLVGRYQRSRGDTFTLTMLSPRSLVERYQHFSLTYFLNVDKLFYSEDEGSRLLRNVNYLLTRLHGVVSQEKAACWGNKKLVLPPLELLVWMTGSGALSPVGHHLPAHPVSFHQCDPVVS